VLLCLILLVHLYAIWVLAHRRQSLPDALPEAPRITFLLNVAPNMKQAPARSTAPISRQPAVGKPAVSALAQDAPALLPAPLPAPGADAVPDAWHPSAAEILAQAKRDMPRIERELRGNVPTRLTLSPDSFRYKLEHGFEAAYTGGDRRAVTEFYTSPDGLIYMRITKSGKVSCSMTGGPVTLRHAMGIDVDKETPVNCPSTSDWKAGPE
jgi:hypothetical protein